MVIDNLDPVRISAAPLIVDADAVLTHPVAAQRLQPIAGRSGQVAQLGRLMNLHELPLRNPLHILRQPSREPAMKQRLGIAIGERADHAHRLYTRRVHVLKRSWLPCFGRDRSLFRVVRVYSWRRRPMACRPVMRGATGR
jgi:hypothetical protein